MSTCELCNRSYANKHSLASHKSRYHRQQSVTMSTSTCDLCNRSYTNKYSLAAHKSRYHPQQSIDTKNGDQDSYGSVSPNQCPNLQREWSLLSAHKTKHRLATKVYLRDDVKLSEEEFWVVDAICKTVDLEIVRKILTENCEIVHEILHHEILFIY